MHNRSTSGRPCACSLIIAAAFFAVFSSVSLFPAPALGALGSPPPVEQLMPAPSFGEGWALKSKPKTFTKETLYQHINGEAELFMPYGFSAAATVLYGLGGDDNTAISVDIYRMGSALDAFGIYSNYRGPDGETVKVGADGFFSGTQLMFYQDQYFVRISASGSGTPNRAAYMACAEAVEGRLPPPRIKPKELDLLKAPQVVPGTEKYIAESVLGYNFFKKGLTAEALVDGKKVKAFVILNESPADARKAFDQYANHLKQSKVEATTTEKDGAVTLLTKDLLYKGLALRLSGPCLVGAASLESPEKGTELLNALEKAGKK